MVLPLIPIAAGIAGTGVGAAIASIFGGEKRTEIHAAKEHFAPVHAPVTTTSRIYSPTQMIQIESPYAKMTKKDVMTAKARGEADIATPRTETVTEGMDMTKIAVIGVIGLVAYGLVSKK